jgi:hypothetical protein
MNPFIPFANGKKVFAGAAAESHIDFPVNTQQVLWYNPGPNDCFIECGTNATATLAGSMRLAVGAYVLMGVSGNGPSYRGSVICAGGQTSLAEASPGTGD